MILKMKKIFVHGLHSDRKAVLEELHKKEAVEVCEPHIEGLSFQETAKSIAQFDKYMQTAEAALAVLNEYCPEKRGFMAGKQSLPIQNYQVTATQSDETLQTIYDILRLNDKIRENRENIVHITGKQAALKPFPEPDATVNTNERMFSESEPADGTQILEEVKADYNRQIQGCISELIDFGKRRRDIELFYDQLHLRKDKYQVLSKTGLTEYTFIIEGYIPKKFATEIKLLLESKYAAYVELSEPGKTEDVPVAFSNGVFASPVEGITETYSLPSQTDIDPNPIMAFFYYLFFGMMFSDAGYGLLLMLVCGYLGFGKRLEKAKRKNFRMFFFCGISTAFWGLLFGGFFGNIVYTISTTFFGREIALNPIWLDPMSQAMSLLVFSVALGMLQILVGMGIKFYILCRQKKIVDAVCDTGFWIAVMLGLCFIAAGFGVKINAFTSAGTWIALFGAAGLLVSGGRKSKSIVGKIFGGVVGLYNITGYVSDALSYCRLMALGLTTGAIANVVNMLGVMFGSSVLGIILFVVVLLFGHTLNFAMNMLGAYVHTNRLQYVEFFSKFYEGGGRKFEPFRLNTKYCSFSQEQMEMESKI